MNYVQLLIYWQCFYAWLGLRYVNHVHYFLCLGKCKFCLVLECNYVLYICVCAVYFAWKKTLGDRRCLFKMCLSHWLFYLSSIKRKFNVTFIHGFMIFNNIQLQLSLNYNEKNNAWSAMISFLKHLLLLWNKWNEVPDKSRDSQYNTSCCGEQLRDAFAE